MSSVKLKEWGGGHRRQRVTSAGSRFGFPPVALGGFVVGGVVVLFCFFVCLFFPTAAPLFPSQESCVKTDRRDLRGGTLPMI